MSVCVPGGKCAGKETNKNTNEKNLLKSVGAGPATWPFGAGGESLHSTRCAQAPLFAQGGETVAVNTKKDFVRARARGQGSVQIRLNMARIANVCDLGFRLKTKL